MERDKMVETILNYMCPFFSDGICRGEIRCHDDCIKKSFAKDAVNELIPEGAVVLTREEYEQLDKYTKDVEVYEMQMKNGKIDMRVGSDNAKLFISTLVNLFRQNGAKNFFTITVECTDNGEKYSLTVKKENGKSLAEATNDNVEQARKETVKEIFRRLCNVEYSIYDDAHGYAGALVREFEKIFNEYGVEVEE